MFLQCAKRTMLEICNKLFCCACHSTNHSKIKASFYTELQCVAKDVDIRPFNEGHTKNHIDPIVTHNTSNVVIGNLPLLGSWF